MPNFMTIHPVGAEYFYAYRGTNLVKLIVAFRNFAKAPKNHLHYIYIYIADLEVSIEPPCLRLLQVGLVISYKVYSYFLALLTMKGSN
jgi:hypothetical protein